ncbi:hypothetical protein LEP1GSC125_1996 [Leptospira mayottensis 200901122]|uniref:Uncharacterized protein n=1 Tax=Leptospira mayottensis 200901122 TaxID=1193010 RepID=A0AA87MSG7_9LEPT|nr:hypothetical protein LEP1GSC125_1996 [Leptospira mayottensis 200901122]
MIGRPSRTDRSGECSDSSEPNAEDVFNPEDFSLVVDKPSFPTFCGSASLVFVSRFFPAPDVGEDETEASLCAGEVDPVADDTLGVKVVAWLGAAELSFLAGMDFFAVSTNVEMSSPDLPMIATGAPTGSRDPSGARISNKTPVSKASISMTALSVSTSAMISPGETESPFCLSQRTILPSDIVGLS